MAQSAWWIGMAPRDVAMFQLHEPKLCMPLSVFMGCLEKALGRPVYTHELCSGSIDDLRAELRRDKPAPTLSEIMGLIPEDKRLCI
jgi:hypothetical protein